MAQLVKHPYRIREVLGLNAHENDQFFSLCDETSKYGFGCKYFFKNYQNMDYWNAFF